MAATYREQYAKGATKGSSLVRMPTGTGKTGVIAVLARCLADTPNVLVLTPWKHLRKQLTTDINERFWTTIGVNHKALPKRVSEFRPSTLMDALTNSSRDGNVLVGTITALQHIHAANSDLYAALRRTLSLVIVDEGHYEPAPDWAAAVRALEKAIILLTATPYRNDLKVFEVDPAHMSVYSHHNALSDKFIRGLRFRDAAFATSQKFVNALLKFFDGEFQQIKPAAIRRPRVIVRCSTFDAVNDVATQLHRDGRSVVAVHERFEESPGDFRYRRVPSPRTSDAVFWVHQNKLIEGLDDPSFSLLAIFEPLRNARALVQQIGRILRNPGQKAGQYGYVFSDPRYHQSDFWSNYLLYDAGYEEDPRKYEPWQLFDDIVALQPQSQYIEGNFRQRFTFDTTDLHREYKYPLRTNVYLVKAGFKLAELERAVLDEWTGRDLNVRRTDSPDSVTRIHSYAVYGYSPLLRDRALFKYDIGFTVYRLAGQHLFYYDVHGNTPEFLVEHARPVSASKLQGLFRGRTARITQVSLRNTDLGRYSVRRRVVQAYSVEQLAPALGDHLSFWSTAQGFTAKNGASKARRYVGLSRARITDTSSVPVSYNDYVTWLDYLAEALEENVAALPVFYRFAAFADRPPDPAPTNILLDLDDTAADFESTVTGKQGKPMKLDLEDLCYDVSEGKFRCRANGKVFPVSIAFNNDTDTYQLSSKELESSYVYRGPVTGKTSQNLVSFLNRTQAFRVIPTTPGFLYSRRHFFHPRLQLLGGADGRRFDLLKVFRPIDKLTSIASEKGKKCRAAGRGWDKQSLFNLIDTRGKGTALWDDLGTIDLLICDDLGAEMADFIAADRKNARVVFIHAKAFSESKQVAASAFHEICSQAVKSLDLVHPYFVVPDSKFLIWDKPWKHKHIGIVDHRIRRGPADARRTWEEIRQIIRDPSAMREVWIILGRGFSLKKFEEAAQKSKQPPQTTQIAYLLQSTWSAVSSVGAVFRIYCSP